MKAVNWKELITDLVIVTIGPALVGGALAMFTVPNDIAPGGVSGLSTALAYITPLSVGTWSLMLNVPLLLSAWKMLGRRTLIYTLIATVLLSASIDLCGKILPAYTNDMLIASVFGGALSGLGMGLLFIRGMSTGGTDLLALLLRKVLPNVPTGRLLMCVDASVVVIAVLIFRDIEVALYSAITIVVCSKIIDTLAEGIDYAKVVYIITSKGDVVVDALNRHTPRGSTVLPGYGGYTHDDKQMVITVTRRNVLAQTLKVIKQADPAAFTYVTDSTEVHGEGFKLDD